MDFSNSDLIKQNTVGQSEGFPIGVPPSYNWYRGWNSGGQLTPPADFTAVEGWGQAYQEVGAPDYFNPRASVEIANAKTYVHVKQTGEWLLVQDQLKLRLTGGHFVPDFSGNVAIPMRVTTLSGAHTAFDAPPPGYNNHFWYGSRGTYAAGTVDAVYVQMDMRVSDPDLRLVAMVGADWWRDATATYLDDHSNNPGIGGTNWVRLSTEWKTLGYYSMSTKRFQEASPPALSGSASPRSPAVSSATVAPPKFTLSNPDSGVVGNLTPSTNLELIGTAEAGNTIVIFDGAKQIGTAMTNASGTWRFTTPRLSKTDHCFTARATDVDGNTSSASALLNIKVDTTPVPAPASVGDGPLIKGTLDTLDEGGNRPGFKSDGGNEKAGQAPAENGDHFAAAVVPQPEHDRPANPGAAALSDSLILLPILICAAVTLRRRGSRNRVCPALRRGPLQPPSARR